MPDSWSATVAPRPAIATMLYCTEDWPMDSRLVLFDTNVIEGRYLAPLLHLISG